MDKMKRLNVPLLFIVGSSDSVISKDFLLSMLRSTATSFFDKKLIVYENLLHRPFDDIGRDQVVADVVKWIFERIKS
jgi:alpha-beta hydrolase superfamily lysophospholipase